MFFTSGSLTITRSEGLFAYKNKQTNKHMANYNSISLVGCQISPIIMYNDGQL